MQWKYSQDRTCHYLDCQVKCSPAAEGKWNDLEFYVVHIVRRYFSKLSTSEQVVANMEVVANTQAVENTHVLLFYHGTRTFREGAPIWYILRTGRLNRNDSSKNSGWQSWRGKIRADFLIGNGGLFQALNFYPVFRVPGSFPIFSIKAGSLDRELTD